MSTIVIAQKNGVACIGADTQVSFGTLKQQAHHRPNESKIIKVNDTYFGLPGVSVNSMVLKSYFSNDSHFKDFSSVDGFFETLRRMHPILKDEYFMLTSNDKDDEYESTQIYGLAINPHGIFGIFTYRSVQAYEKFWALGSGRNFALGAMLAVYESAKTAEDVVLAGLSAGAEFDDGSSAPFEHYSVKLQ